MATEEKKGTSIRDIRRKLGMVYFRKGETSNAIRVWQRILDEDPNDKDIKNLVEEAKVALDM
ncbi:tetratricopeptide repeat protein [Candidatus Falkowbacteria bacterium]|nr:tetratricopeptide repeat protein [Candidatus Falkowbacteria bacterium]